jgi:phosphatidylinositol alpha-1,6-mannosyltransferase
LLVTFDYPPMVGGIATLFGTLWHRAAGDSALILAPAGRGAAGVDAARAVRTFRFPVVRGDGVFAKALNTVSCAVWFAALAARFRPALVIAGQIRRAGRLAYLWSRLTGRPFAVWVYGGETSPDFTGSRRGARHVRSALAAARPVFSISPFTTRMLAEFGLPRERIVEVRLGVDEAMRPRPREARAAARLGLDGKLVFLTVGRLVERKGIDTMLEALAGLDDRLPPWRYLVVSDGPQRARLEALARRLGLDGKVVFTGFVPHDELPIYYNLCDVFAMPNRAVGGDGGASLSVEGFGMVLLDAAACGKPVIAGRSGGAVDAVDDGINGLLVAPDDVADLQRAIVELLDPNRRAAMGRAGTAWAARFSWQTAAETLRPHLGRPLADS